MKAFAPQVGRSVRQCYDYEQGNVEPPADVLQKWGEATRTTLAELTASPEVPTTDRSTDHPGVRELAADAVLCRAHKVSVDELQQLAGLRIVSLTGQPIVIQTAAQALAYLQALRQSTPHP